jgi:hypothetical protein
MVVGMRSLSFLSMTAVLTLVGTGSARAAGYSILPVAHFGDLVGSARIQSGVDGDFEIGSLINNGAISFVTKNTAGGEMLAVYAGGALAPVVVGGGPAFNGLWPTAVGVLSPVSMNQTGNIAFVADQSAGFFNGPGAFMWDATKKQFVPVAVHGMPLTFNLTFDDGSDWVTAINDNNEIAFVATVEGSASPALSGDFFRNRAGTVLAVALPDGVLGDGSQILDACHPSLNNQDIIAFSVRRKNDADLANSCYLWQQGVTSPVAKVGTTLPGGIRLANVVGNWVNNANSSVLLAVQTGPPLNEPSMNPDSLERPTSLYLWNNGVFTPVAVPGQSMPDGSKFVSVQDFGVSFANDLGQHAFLAILDDGSTAAYLMTADGTLSLIMKSGTSTTLGTVQNVGEGAGTSSGVALNKSGQVTFTAQINNGVDTIVLLTPTP